MSNSLLSFIYLQQAVYRDQSHGGSGTNHGNAGCEEDGTDETPQMKRQPFTGHQSHTLITTKG